MAPGDRTGGKVLAVHREGRHTLNLVVAADFLNPLEPHADVEGAVGIGEFLRIDAVLDGPFLRAGLGVQRLLFNLHRIEDLTVQTGKITGGLQREVQLGEPGKLRVAPGDRHTHEGDVGRQLLDPHVEQGIEGLAVGAPVVEELQHFDLALDLGRLGRRYRLGAGGGQRQGRQGHATCYSQGGKLLEYITTLHYGFSFNLQSTH